MKKNVILGIAVGFIFATLLSAWVTGVRLLSGEDAFAEHNTTFGGVLVAYYSAGVVGGALLGSMLHIGRTALGRVVLSALGAFVLVFFVVTAVDGPFWRWGSEEWEFITFGTVLFGAAGFVAWWKASTR